MRKMSLSSTMCIDALGKLAHDILHADATMQLPTTAEKVYHKLVGMGYLDARYVDSRLVVHVLRSYGAMAGWRHSTKFRLMWVPEGFFEAPPPVKKPNPLEEQIAALEKRVTALEAHNGPL